MRKKTWSLVELTIILIVLSILCAILMPVIDRYIRNAKVCRAREDVQAIGMAICMFIEDTANSYFLLDGGELTGEATREAASGAAPDQDTTNRVTMLVSDGDIPEQGTDGDAAWHSVINNGTIDFLEDHLVTNTVAYRTPTDLINPAADAMFARSESGGFNSEFAWRGPYMTAPIDPDPWGNRYMVNVVYLDALADSDADAGGPPVNAAVNGVCGYENDVVVLTAGPDEETDSDFAVDGLVPGDDDILYTISGNSRP